MPELSFRKETLLAADFEKKISGTGFRTSAGKKETSEFSSDRYPERLPLLNSTIEQSRIFTGNRAETRLELKASQRQDVRLKKGDEIVVVDGKRFIKRPKPIEWDNVGDKYYWAFLSAIGNLVKWVVMGIVNGILWLFRAGIQKIINRNYPSLRNYEPPQPSVELPDVYLKNRASIARIFEAANADNMWGKFFWSFVVSGIVIGTLPLINVFALPVFLFPVWFFMMAKKLKIEWMDKFVARAEKIRKFFFGEKQYDLIPVS